MALLVGNPKRVLETDDIASHWLKKASDATEQNTDANLVVDMHVVETISSDELTALIRLHTRLRNEGRQLVLENVQDQLWQIFTVTRLDRLIEIREPATA